MPLGYLPIGAALDCLTFITSFNNLESMANSQDLNQTLRDIFIENEFEARFDLFIELLGVKTIRDVTLISHEDMKQIHKFSYIELRKLRDIQIRCAKISGVDVPPSCHLIAHENTAAPLVNYMFDEQSNYRGLGLIIVTEKFCDGEVRKGASLDSEIFHTLFTKMKLQIVPIPNATRLDFLTKVKQEISTNIELSSFFIAISSHGKEGDKILCEDKNFVTVTEIIAMLQIPELINKPKVLLIEACRGKLRDEIETDYMTENFPTYPAATKQSDILVVYSCVPGYVAYRDTTRGSWFVNTLLDAYETAGNEDFVRILTCANRIMLERNFQDGIQISKQPMHVESTLSKLLFI